MSEITKTQDDPRRGLPSASALNRLANCYASFKLSKAARASGDVPPKDAATDSGTRIHRYLETGTDEDFEALSHSERETANICSSMKDRVIADWAGENPHAEHREERLGLTRMGQTRLVLEEYDGIDFVFTGMADVVCIQTGGEVRRGLVIDYKTGPGEVEAANANNQLSGLAVLAAGFYKLDEVTVAIIQPLAGKPSVAVYDDLTLESASGWLDNQLEELESEHDHDPRPGDWCQYCDARLICSAFKNSVHGQVETLVAGNEHSKDVVYAKASALPNDDLAALLKGKRMIGWYLSAIEGVAKQRLTEGQTIPGFELKEKNGRRVIADTDKASAVLFPLLAGAEGGSQAALLRSAVLRPTALEEELQKASGRKNARSYNLTGKDAKALLEQALDGIMVIPKIKSLQEVGMLLDEEGDEG